MSKAVVITPAVIKPVVVVVKTVVVPETIQRVELQSALHVFATC